MDPALLKQRQAFISRATTNLSVQPKPQASSHTTYVSEEQRKKKKKKVEEPKKPEQPTEFNYKTAQSSMNSTYFATMARIIDFMKKRHLNQQQWGLSLKEALDEMQIYDLNKKSIAWLEENLPANPKLHFDDGKFAFKPPYKVTNKLTLKKQLEKNHLDGKGGVLLSELNECLSNAEATAKSLEKDNKLIDIPTQVGFFESPYS